jgi:hypothetical protein
LLSELVLPFEEFPSSEWLEAACEARSLERSVAAAEVCEDAPFPCFISPALRRSDEVSARDARLDDAFAEGRGELSLARSVACSRELCDCASGLRRDSRFCELEAGDALGLAELSALDCSRCAR